MANGESPSEAMDRFQLDVSQFQFRRLLALCWLALATLTVLLAAMLLWLKLPNPPVAVPSPRAPAALPAPGLPPAPVAPADRALTLAAIEKYVASPARAGRSAIPVAELIAKVIAPLEKSGALPAEVGRKVLDTVLDGGKELVTEYFRQRWANEFGTDGNGAPRVSAGPSMVCAPTFNAVNAGPAAPRPVPIPAAHAPPKHPKPRARPKGSCHPFPTSTAPAAKP